MKGYFSRGIGLVRKAGYGMNHWRTAEKNREQGTNQMGNGDRKRTEEKHKQDRDITEKIITKNERKRNKKQIEEKQGRKN